MAGGFQYRLPEYARYGQDAGTSAADTGPPPPVPSKDGPQPGSTTATAASSSTAHNGKQDVPHA